MLDWQLHGKLLQADTMMRVLPDRSLFFLMLPAIASLSMHASAQPTAPLDGASAAWRNAYAQDLGEQHIERGRAAMLSGELVDAERSLLEAIQVIKVNYGLHSRQQILPLRLLIETRIHLGDWAAVDRQIHYFEWLNDRNHRQDFDAYLEGMSSLNELLLMASGRLDNPTAVRYLITARDLNWQALTAIESRLGKDHETRLPWLYRIVLNHYYQSTLIRRRGLTSYAFKSDGDTLVSGWTLSRNETLDISYRVGQELLQQIHASYADQSAGDPEKAAQILAYQGDWELLFGHHQRAYRHYGQAHQALLTAGLSRTAANAFFAVPVTLPRRALPEETQQLPTPGGSDLLFNAWSPLYPATPHPASLRAFKTIDTESMQARARFDLVPIVDSGGVARSGALRLENFELLSTDPPGTGVGEQARAQISLLSFRPKLLDGRPVAANAIELLYRFPSQLNEISLGQR